MINQLTLCNNGIIIREYTMQIDLEKEYASLYDFNPSIIFTIDNNYIIQKINIEAATLLGIEKSQLINKRFLNYITSNSEFIFKEKIQKLYGHKLKQICKIELLPKGEEQREVIAECSLVNDNLIQVCLMDISSNHQLEQQNFELEKTFTLIASLFQNANDAIAVIDDQFYLKVINESFSELLGKIIHTKINIDMNLMRALSDFPELKAKIFNACQKALKETKSGLVLESPVQNTEVYYYYEISIHSIKYSNDQRYKLLFRINNLTDYKLEERLQHQWQADVALSCRTSAMGEMVLALTHEINQPLTAILTYSRAILHIMNKKENKNTVEKHLLLPLEKIAAQAELAGEIIHNMKSFTSKEKMEVEETDINQVIRDTLSIFQYELFDFKLTINLNLIENLPLIMTNKTHMMQVILNLARNSFEAFQRSSETNPTLTIETNQSQDFIYVHIRDNGPGIPDEFRNKVLGTYFTTKPKGTGIGLGICLTLIEKHGGTLYVQQQEKGAWFTFTLPISPSPHNNEDGN